MPGIPPGETTHPQLRPATDNDRDDLVEVTLRAFEPVFKSFTHILGPEIFSIVYPDWRATQRGHIVGFLDNPGVSVWVAELDGKAVGLVVYELKRESRTGEIQFLAVHPDYQSRGIGTALSALALERMREAGMVLAVVATGGDASHAPARRAYEKAGYTAALPSVRYYHKL